MFFVEVLQDGKWVDSSYSGLTSRADAEKLCVELVEKLPIHGARVVEENNERSAAPVDD